MAEELHNLIGRTKLARSPIASSAPGSQIPIPPTTSASAMPVGPREDEATSPEAAYAMEPTAEEQVLLLVLRMVDRANGLQPLSPVERALVEGAKVTFDRLAKACKSMLDRKTSDLLVSIVDPTEPPTSALRPNPPATDPKMPKTAKTNKTLA